MERAGPVRPILALPFLKYVEGLLLLGHVPEQFDSLGSIPERGWLKLGDFIVFVDNCEAN